MLGAAATQAAVPSSENFTLARDALIAGGAASSTAYQLRAAIGESSAGGAGSESFVLAAGFSARHAVAVGSSTGSGAAPVAAGGGGGCTLSSAEIAVDPLFPLLLLGALLWLMRRHLHH